VRACTKTSIIISDSKINKNCFYSQKLIKALLCLTNHCASKVAQSALLNFSKVLQNNEKLAIASSTFDADRINIVRIIGRINLCSPDRHCSIL